MIRACAICGGDARLRFEGLWDDRHGYPGSFDLQECSACGHCQLGANFTEAELAALYTRYYPRKASAADEVAPHRDASGLRAWLNGDRSSAYRWVPRGVRVLDIGSGLGQTLMYHDARGCDAWGVELDDNAKEVAARHGLKLRFGAFDPAAFDAASFDFVTLDQVLEHAVDPIRLLRGAASLLRAEGRMIVSTPNCRGWGARLFGRRWINWHVPYHLHHFSRESLRRAAREAGLEVERLRTLTNSAWLLYQWLHLIAMPAPGKPSRFWDVARAPGGLPAWPQRAAILAHALRFNHLATRAADALGAGDNFLCVLRRQA